jgi:predicted PolB exonuclease-like 3'-5' exonuclease
MTPDSTRAPMAPVLVFDIETIPDIAGLRSLNGWDAGVSDAEVAARAFASRQEATGRDFMPHHLQRVVAISCVFRDDEGLRVRSLGSTADGEAKLIQDFFRTVERYKPQLVSWNGGGFDLPVLHYRGLIHGIQAGRYWELGEEDREFKWNNYISRYHMRHLDLMDVLALYQPRATAPLDALARLCGFPGKLGMDGSKVWETYLAGGLAEIRDYCETDVMNTWLVYCRFQLMRGCLSPGDYEAEIALARHVLSTLPGAHWKEYLDVWDRT